MTAAVIGSAACAGNKGKSPSTADVLADSADQVMYGMDFYLNAYGVNRARLFADTAFFFENNTRVELRSVKTDFYTTTGEPNATLTSQTGQYLTNTDAMIARKNVVVKTTDGRTLRSEELRYDRYANLVSTDSAFTLTEADGRNVEGIGFRSDPNLQHVQVLRVRSGSAGLVNIPRK